MHSARIGVKAAAFSLSLPPHDEHLADTGRFPDQGRHAGLSSRCLLCLARSVVCVPAHPPPLTPPCQRAQCEASPGPTVSSFPRTSRALCH